MYSIGCITNLRMYKVNMKMQTLTYFNVLKTVFNSKENPSHIFYKRSLLFFTTCKGLQRRKAPLDDPFNQSMPQKSGHHP